MHKDAQQNPASFYSRKGCYALNVQCSVDHCKKVWCVSYSHKGASHDSSCFYETELYKNMSKASKHPHKDEQTISNDQATTNEKATQDKPTKN